MRTITIITLLSFAILGCKREQKYPRFVRNPCMNQWAIQTGYGMADRPFVSGVWMLPDYKSEKEPIYVGEIVSYFTIPSNSIWGDSSIIRSDTVFSAAAGYEMTFPDSLSAVHFWTVDKVRIDLERQDVAAKAKANHDKLKADFDADKQWRDSVYKCMHTYK